MKDYYKNIKSTCEPGNVQPVPSCLPCLNHTIKVPGIYCFYHDGAGTYLGFMSEAASKAFLYGGLYYKSRKQGVKYSVEKTSDRPRKPSRANNYSSFSQRSSWNVRDVHHNVVLQVKELAITAKDLVDENSVASRAQYELERTKVTEDPTHFDSAIDARIFPFQEAYKTEIATLKAFRDLKIAKIEEEFNSKTGPLRVAALASIRSILQDCIEGQKVLDDIKHNLNLDL